MLTSLTLAIAAALSVAPAGQRPLPDSTLEARIAARVAAVSGARVGVAWLDLGGSDSLFVGADSSFHAASTMKVPVMIELFRQVDAGRLRLDQEILLVNTFGSIVDGSPYALSAADDSDSSLYALVGRRVSVSELTRRMIVRSSNLATNALIEIVGAARAHETARTLGATRIEVRRGVEDGKAYQAGLNNTTTARDLAVLLAALARGTAASRAGSAAMLALLEQQEFNDAIPAGLPAGTRVAHKTGNITAVAHDAAIVFPPGRAPYVLVVLTRGVPEEKRAHALIADIARLVHAHATARAGAR
jgi:beta-lactamase class A